MASSPKAPTPPDPQETAAAQTATNVATAQANAALGNTNQITPYGSLTYDKTGSEWIADANGPQTNDAGETGYYVPTYTATTTLSDAEQQKLDLANETAIGLNTFARDQTARANNLLSEPVDMDTEAIEAHLMDLGRQRLDPVLAERRDALETRLANQGIQRGSTAYTRAMQDFGETENDAYNQLALTGRQQAIQETLTPRNQSINEITALLYGGQVNNPQFQNIAGPQLPTVDYAGLVNQNYNQQLGAWQQQQASRNGLLGGALGGLFSLGGGALAGGYF